MALIKKKTDSAVMDKVYEGRCKLKVYDSVSDWKANSQSDKPIDPMTHIEDLYLRCDFDQDDFEPVLKVNIRVRNLLEEKIPMKIKLFLYEDMAYEPIGTMDIRMVAQGKTATKGYFELPLSNIKLWSDQEPNLYEVLVVMTDHFDAILQVVSCQYGFREIRIRGEKIWLNRKPLLLKGVNYRRDYKKNLNEDIYWKDLMLLKQYNVNAVKVNGDYVDEAFYGCCDALGFYVVTEVGDIGNSKEVILSKTTSVIGNGRNHPSIIMWSLESALNKRDNLEIKKVMLSLDDRRPYLIHSEEDFFMSDVFIMKKTKSMDEHAVMAYKKKPAIVCTNNQMGYEAFMNLKPVMDSMHTYSRWHGGFIGDFINYFSDSNHSNEKGYEILPLAFEIKKAYEPYTISFDSQTAFYNIKNLNLLDEEIKVRVIVQEDGTPIMEEYLEPVCIKSGENISGVIKSWLQLKNETVLYHIVFEILLEKDGFWAKKGHILANAQFEMEGYRPAIYTPKSSIDCIINETNQSIEVISEKTHYLFDKNTGYISQIKVDNKALLAQPIQPIWRSLSDSKTDTEAIKVQNHGQVKAYRIDRKGSQVDLYFDIKIKAIKTLLLIKYEIFSTGELNVCYEGEPEHKMDRLGSSMTFSFIKNQVNWFGRGPHPSCFDTMMSTQMGLYQMDLFEMNALDKKPIKSGTYKDIRWMTLTDTEGEGIMVESLEDRGFDVGLISLEREVTTLCIGQGKMLQNKISTSDTSALETEKQTCRYRFLFMEAL